MSIKKDTKFTLNGSEDLVAGDTSYEWDNGYLGYVSLYSDSSRNVTIAATLAGSKWTVSTLRFSGLHESVVINDSASGSQ